MANATVGDLVKYTVPGPAKTRDGIVLVDNRDGTLKVESIYNGTSGPTVVISRNRIVDVFSPYAR